MSEKKKYFDAKSTALWWSDVHAGVIFLQSLELL